MMLVPRQLEGFDVDNAIARMLGRPQLWWQTLGYFVHGFADWPQRWQASQQDAAQERRVVHALRSATVNVGARDLADAARQLEYALAADAENTANAAETPDLAALRARLLAAFMLAWAAADAAWTQSGAQLPE